MISFFVKYEKSVRAELMKERLYLSWIRTVYFNHHMFDMCVGKNLRQHVVFIPFTIDLEPRYFTIFVMQIFENGSKAAARMA